MSNFIFAPNLKDWKSNRCLLYKRHIIQMSQKVKTLTIPPPDITTINNVVHRLSIFLYSYNQHILYLYIFLHKWGLPFILFGDFVSFWQTSQLSFFVNIYSLISAFGQLLTKEKTSPSQKQNESQMFCNAHLHQNKVYVRKWEQCYILGGKKPKQVNSFC